MDKRWTLAIDFGTTFTSAAVGADGRIDLIEVDGVVRLPSAVLWLDDRFAVGVAAEAQRAAHPDRLERTPKRHLGVREHMILGGTPVVVVDAVAAVLQTVYQEAIRRRDGDPPDLVCLTHPARWGEARLQALAEAAAKAGIENPTFLAEPIAAALRYADVNIGPGDHVAVYDLGGGTFDTAVLRRTDDGFVLVGPPGGDERLGGEDFDHRLADHLRAQIAVVDPDAALSLATSPERIWRVAAAELLSQARLAKEALSTQSSYTVYLPAPIDRELRVTRPEFEALVRADLLRTVDELGIVVQKSGLRRDELTAIYLTGGSSRIPLVTNLVHEAFAQVPNTWEDPKCVVALGAIRADALRNGAVPAQPGTTWDSEPPTRVMALAGSPSTPPRISRHRLGVAVGTAVAAGVLVVAVASAAGGDPVGSMVDDLTTTSDVVVSSTDDGSIGDPTLLPTTAPEVTTTQPEVTTTTESTTTTSTTTTSTTTTVPPPPPDPFVPTVIGQDLETAAANLQAVGYNDLPYLYDCYGSNSPGTVVAQEPAGGSPAATPTPIRLFLQADNCGFIPLVLGMDLDTAAATLQDAGFNDIPYLYECYGSPDILKVVNQQPVGGQVALATPIRLELQANNC
jgi:hypothetical protein